jgi:hypothetical protein
VQQETEWYQTMAKTKSIESPAIHCRAGERRCHCDFDLVRSLETSGKKGLRPLLEPPLICLRDLCVWPGLTHCGNCMDDVRNCECYVMSWLIKFMASSRPCWCNGNCIRSPYSYVCQTDTKCSGWFGDSCETIVRWCPRNERYSCIRCDAPHMDDKDDHCLVA